jgi:hypothetical protein
MMTRPSHFSALPVRAWALTALVTVAAGLSVSGQDRPQQPTPPPAPSPAPAPPPAGGRAAAPLPPPPPQAGHPSGKLVIWGDLASFDQPATNPTHCILLSRFKRGQRVGIRMTAIDGGSGETENTAVLVAHLVVGGNTVDVPMRWRGAGNFPASEYPRQPSEMWTGAWVVPADAPLGVIKYTVTATDRFRRTASFSPFINVVSQFTIVE